MKLTAPLIAFVFLYAIASGRSSSQEAKQPHIFFILADDLGFNDVPWHNAEVVAPNLQALADGGMILEQSYVQPMCTPTRSALLSGRYPFTIGRQKGVIWPMMPTGLTLDAKTIPEYLKQLKYSTHAIGKWHLGFCNWKYTPTERGFDTFRGYYTGSEDYYTKMRNYFTEERIYGETFNKEGRKPVSSGFDYRNNKDVCYNASKTYSTYDYADHFKSVVQKRNNTSPLFMYMAFQSVHSPREVPAEYIKPFLHIKDKNRRIYLGMVSAMDEAIGKMVQSIKDAGIYDNSVIIFSTDNGGPTKTGGNNWPLRGNKTTIWEGGTRGAALIHSQLLPYKGVKSNLLMHTTDWMSTILSMAGGKPPTDTDGVDQWQALTGKAKSPRKEIVYNIVRISDEEINAGIRFGRFKLLVGDPGPGEWTPPPESTKHSNYNRNQNKDLELFRKRLINIRKRIASKMVRKCKRNRVCLLHIKGVFLRHLRGLQKRKMERVAKSFLKRIENNKIEDNNRIKRSLNTIIAVQNYTDSKNATNDVQFGLENQLLSGKVKLRLYDLESDPEERQDISSEKGDVVRSLVKRLISHMDRYVPPDNPHDNNRANPKFWNGVWSPGWC